MALNIKNVEVERKARELARRRKISITDAIDQALDEQLKRERHRATNDDTARRLASIRQIQDRVRASLPSDGRSWQDVAEDLYDEHGAPK
jgi:antitoxin VapB